jgi:polar amino acid transport system substrate-binding protein
MAGKNESNGFRFLAFLSAKSPRITSAIQSILRTTLLVFFSILLSISATRASAAETIEITTGEYAPWTSESLKHGGFSTHVITEAFKLEGYDVNFTFYPWKRVYDAAKDGKRFHASAWWYTSEERARDFHYSAPLLVDSTVFFYIKDNPIPDWETLDDLKGRRIGATAGYTYTPEFWEAAKSKRLNIQEASSDELNFKKLLKGRIDMFPTSDLVGQKLLKEKFGPEESVKVAFHPRPLFAAPGHLLFSRQLENGEELMSIFNRGLMKLRDSGQYDQFWADLIAGNYDQ